MALAIAMLAGLAACGSAGSADNKTDQQSAQAQAGEAAGGAGVPEEEGAQAQEDGGIKTVEQMIAEKNELEPEVESDGVVYARKKGLSTYLFMGVDLSGYAAGADEYQETGRADTILLYIVDDANKSYRVLQINRDTMVPVDILNIYGKKVGETVQQLCLAYCYSGSVEANCQNVVNAVSNLLGGIPIDGYVSLQFGAIPDVNDALGGVAVKIEDDYSQDDPTLVQGETVVLEGEHAISYLRHRLSVGDGTNTSRMHRQMVYLAAFTARLKEELRSGNSAIINKLYNAAAPYMYSNMSVGTISNVAVKCAGYSQGSTKTLAGTSKEVTYSTGLTNVEYTVEQAAIDDAVLDLFYTAID